MSRIQALRTRFDYRQEARHLHRPRSMRELDGDLALQLPRSSSQQAMNLLPVRPHDPDRSTTPDRSDNDAALPVGAFYYIPVSAELPNPAFTNPCCFPVISLPGAFGSRWMPGRPPK